VNLVPNWSVKPYYLLGLSLLSGLLLGLAWYSPTTILLFIGFAPILAIEQHIAQHPYRRPLLTLWGYTYLAFLVWNVSATWWLWNSSPGASIFAFTANSFLMTIPILLFHITKKASTKKFGYLSFFMCWLAWEHLHLQDWGFSWPWLTLGNAFGFHPAWVQWYEYSGVLGGSLWALIVNFLVFEALWENSRIRKLNVTLAAMVLVGPMAASWLVYADYHERGTPVEIVVVQPNLDCYSEKFEYNAKTGGSNQGTTFVPYDEQMTRFLALSRQKVGSNTAFLAFPETSLHRAFDEQQAATDTTLRRIKAFRDQYPQLSLLSGADSYLLYPDNASNSPTIRQSGNIFYEVFNTAVFFGDREQTEFYHKSRLVVGVEENPLAKFFHLLDDKYMLNLGGMVGNLGKQKERSVFLNHDSVGIAPLICYESIYGEFVTGYIRKKANILGIISNDGWWGNTPGHVQLLAIGSLRAIETRRAIARAANTGISGFINQRGEVVQASKYGEMTVLKATVKANDETTFYVEWGDYIGRLASFLAAFMVLSSLVRGKLRPLTRREKSKKLNPDDPEGTD